MAFFYFVFWTFESALASEMHASTQLSHSPIIPFPISYFGTIFGKGIFSKKISMMSRLFLLRFLFFTLSISFSNCFLAQDVVSVDHDSFPSNAVWVNTERPAMLENLTDKVVLVVLTDEYCVECNYYMKNLEQELLFTPTIQLLEVMRAGQNKPVTKNHLVQYIQRNAYTHPIGIFPDFTNFQSSNITKFPFFLLYEKGLIPTVSAGGQEGFVAVINRLQTIVQENMLLPTCSTYQLKNYIEPRSWANPVVETPTYIACQDDAKGIFINDAAHQRILGFDENGNMIQPIGSTIPGFLDSGIYDSQFNHPQGMVYHNSKLYIADTYNNRVRVVDLKTEKVSTLLGNGYITWTRTDAIDSKFQPLGLPTDVAVMNGKLYVASGATNQIFEVDIKDGNARSFCDLPQDARSQLRNAPINLAVSRSELLVTMADGSLFTIDKRGKAIPFTNKQGFLFNGACEWSAGTAAITRDGQVVYFEKNKWIVVGESAGKKGAKNSIALGAPIDIMNRDGELFIADTDNHFIRVLVSPTDKLMKNFWMKISPPLVGFEAAHTYGELILMDSVLFSKQDVRVNVLLDLKGYKIVPGGQNEVLMNDITGFASLTSEAIKKDSFSLEIKKGYPDAEVYVELYLTLEHPESPGLYIIKRAYLDFPVFEVDKSSKEQDQIFSPNLLPY